MELRDRRRRRFSRRGQIALVDGIIFLSLLLLAFFFLMDVFLTPVGSAGQNSNGQSYVRATLNTLVLTTYPTASFPLHSGKIVEQDQGVARLLTEAVYLLASGQTSPQLLLHPGAVGWALQLELQNLTQGSFGHFNLTVVAPAQQHGVSLDLGAQSTYSPIDMYVQQIGLPSPPGWNGPISVTLEIWNT
ncbi:MAG: hypothetical protein M1144_03650 [Candidatus Thermoplasmatota archaeon]|jgi:hypothetical protein|nr:hypothetical protein [Candidatus Thermoplasmatota archaeon]MCL5984861.1 hypothetical protein [Candidatus Thermoplasmatota archaeon]